MEPSSRHEILARSMPIYTRSGYDFTHHPLQHDIWCLVRIGNGTFEYRVLSECQERTTAGDVIYDDIDCGEGVHPDIDKAWVHELKSRGQWPLPISKVKAVVRHKLRDHVTVLLSAEKDKGEVLNDTNLIFASASNRLKRVPCSMFPRRMHKQLLEKITQN
jgi:hypothetical protein